MTNEYEQKFDKQLASMTSPKEVRELGKRYSLARTIENINWFGTATMTVFGTVGAALIIYKFGAEMSIGNTIATAMMPGTLGIVGACETYYLTKKIRNIKRNQRKISKKASKLEQSVEQSEFTNPELV